MRKLTAKQLETVIFWYMRHKENSIYPSQREYGLAIDLSHFAAHHRVKGCIKKGWMEMIGRNTVLTKEARMKLYMAELKATKTPGEEGDL